MLCRVAALSGTVCLALASSPTPAGGVRRATAESLPGAARVATRQATPGRSPTWLGRARQVVAAAGLGDRHDAVQLVREPSQTFSLQLADALARDPELLADRLEG